MGGAIIFKKKYKRKTKIPKNEPRQLGKIIFEIGCHEVFKISYKICSLGFQRPTFAMYGVR